MDSSYALRLVVGMEHACPIVCSYLDHVCVPIHRRAVDLDVPSPGLTSTVFHPLLQHRHLLVALGRNVARRVGQDERLRFRRRRDLPPAAAAAAAVW